MPNIRKLGLTALLLVLAVACGSSAVPPPAVDPSAGVAVGATSPTQSAIEPVPNDDRKSDIYVVDPETGKTTQLLSARGSQEDAEFSPNGRRVAYESRGPGGQSQIYVLEPDGTERKLTDLRLGASDPAWSPDGTQIAFSGTRGGAGSSRFDSDIFVMKADGSRIRRFAGTPNDDGHPDWSPDGSSIAFHSGYRPRSKSSSDPPPRGTILVASVDDENITRLTSSYGGGQPAWSPDGRWIAYSRFSPGSSSGSGGWAYADLWTVRPGGSEREHIGHRQYNAFWHNPSWSPNGGSIVVEAGGSIGIVDVESERLRVLMDAPEVDPSWSPDGILVSLSPADASAMPRAAVATVWTPTWEPSWSGPPDTTVVLTGSGCEQVGGANVLDPGVLAVEFVNESYREATFKVVRLPHGRRLADLRTLPLIGGGWGERNMPSTTDIWSSPREVASGRWAVVCFKDLIDAPNGFQIVPAGVVGPIEIG